MACPLPEHPELKYGDDPLTPEKRADIAKIERKFNPNKAVTDDEKYVLQQNREKNYYPANNAKVRRYTFAIIPIEEKPVFFRFYDPSVVAY